VSFHRGLRLAGFARRHLGRMAQGRREAMGHLQRPDTVGLPMPTFVQLRVTNLCNLRCKMCGQCALSSTGMSCSMNCPKNLRNGPCGGVRDDGNCEVLPEMKCVWHEAFAGAQRIPGGIEKLRTVQLPVDRRLVGKSSWLRVARLRAGEPE